MRKPWIILLSLCFSLSLSLRGEVNVLLKIDVKNLAPREHIKLLRWDGEKYSTCDSTSQGENGSLQSHIERAEIAYLAIGRNKAIPLFLTEETFLVSGDATRAKTLTVKGNADQAIYNRYLFLLDAFDLRMEKWSLEREKAAKLNKRSELQRIAAEERKVVLERHAFMERYAHTNAFSPVSVYVAHSILNALSAESLKKLLKAYAENGLDDPMIAEMQQHLEVLQNTEIGSEAPLLLLQGANKETTLASYRGQYVYLYFWASWCSACRKEIAELKSCYEKYHKHGLEIVAISLDTDRNRWQKALKEDSCQWVNSSDLLGSQSNSAKLYGINLLPSGFLLDPDGIIIRKKLSPQELDKACEKILLSL